MRTFPLLILITMLCASVSGFAQTNDSTSNSNTQNVDVTAVYEQVVIDGHGSASIYKELANAHYFKNNPIEAKKWFEILFKTEKITDETLLFRYEQTLKALKIFKKPSDFVMLSMSH